ncbi:MAG: ABC-F family ATP-binding cassette domain-containing protein [Bacteroidales bacterium]|jgi:ATP-binding cassette subfamily F protein uup
MISYFQTDCISRRIGDNLLFENISININRDDKIAVVGVNGSGKSSLLDIIGGKEKPDTGSVNMKRDLRISYLEQNPVLNESNTIVDEIFSAGNKISQIVRDYERSLITGDNARIQKMIQKMDDNKAWDYEVTVKQILFRLRLTDLDSRIKDLSGGERKRVALAKALVEDYDLLILDEPTNHLDLEMIEWLEDYLLESTVTLIMVTHDRYFLDRVCTVILELVDKKVTKYDGNYSYYVEKKQENESARKNSSEKAENLFRKELEWMRRMPKARRHKSRSRSGSFFELRDSLAKGAGNRPVSIDVDIPRMGKKIIGVNKISKSYGGKTVIKDFTYLFNRYEKAGLVGRNGSGKTTLLNILSGAVRPDSGEVEWGQTVKMGYYRQEGITFDGNMTVFDAASAIAEKVNMSDGNSVTVSQFLSYFLFPPDRQRTYVKKLSGGEKRRLYLLTVLMQNPNFLLMDEPTNDLDILTLNVLEDYLSGFRGCVIIASHDRYFMDKIAEHVFEYKENGVIKDFPGNYTELRNSQSDVPAVEVKPVRKDDSSGRVKPERAPKGGLTFKEKKELELIETEIQEAEAERSSIESELSGGKLSQEQLHIKSERLGEILKLLEDKEMRWIELSEK